MFTTLVKKEILNNLLNLRFALAYFLVTVLMVGSAAVMLSDYLSDKDVYDINKSAYDRRNNNHDDVYDYFFGTKFVVRPPSPTRFLALGEEKDPDRRAAIACEFPPYFYGDFKRNPLSNLFPSLDMVFIIGVVISLLVFVLTYDCVAGEREEGTLKVLLSGPVPRDQVMLAKFAGGLASLVIPLVTSWIVVVLLLLFTRSATLTGADWVRILVFFVVSVLYVATVFSLSLLVSLSFRSSAAAILALLLVWVAAIVALPAISPSIGYFAVKPPSVQSVDLAMRRVGVLEWGDVNKRAAAEFNRRHTGRDWEALSEDERESWRRWDRENDFVHVEHITDSIPSVARRADRMDVRVERVARWVTRLSPYGCYQNASIALAGTGMERRMQLRRSLEDYSIKAVEYALVQGRKDMRTNESFAEMGPTAHLGGVRVIDAVSAGLLDIAALAVMCVLFFMGGYLLFMRTEII